MKAQIRTNELKKLIKATGKFISKDDTRPTLGYIRLDFNHENNTVRAVALDGYHIATEEAKCAYVDECFSAYIKPYMPVGAKAEFSIIEMVNSSCFIDVDGRMVGYKQPEGQKFNDAEFFEITNKNPVVFKIGVNRTLLMDALRTMSVEDIQKEPVILEFRGEISPIIIRNKSGTKAILPVRIRE